MRKDLEHEVRKPVEDTQNQTMENLHPMKFWQLYQFIKVMILKKTPDVGKHD